MVARTGAKHMTPETLTAIREHAREAYPAESCGLISVVKGREWYVRCRNLAEKAGQHFVMDPEDYAAAEDRGTITAIVHSHPGHLEAKASQADRVACETSGLPWYIVAVSTNDGDVVAWDTTQIAPEGYEAPLVGRQWHHGILDCYSCIRDWYARERGITLPDFDRPDDWWNDGHSSLYLDHFREAGFVPASEPMQVGDVILMEIRSDNGVPNHAAVWLGEGRILHHLAGRLSSVDVWGGIYKDYLRLVVRYAGKVETSDRQG